MSQKRKQARSKSGRVFRHPSQRAQPELRFVLHARVSTCHRRNVAVTIDADESTVEAINDWAYWLVQGYLPEPTRMVVRVY
jgi:hypothetical protein